MLRLQTILFPTDFSPCSDVAFAHAIWWARRMGSQLRMLHVVPAFGDNLVWDEAAAVHSEEAFLRKAWAEAAAKMQALIDAHGAGDVSIQMLLGQGPLPSSLIIQYQREAEVDLVVLGMHTPHTATPDLSEGVTAQVMGGATCPVLFVHADEGPPGSLRRILLYFDFKLPTSDVLRYAGALATHFDAALEVLYFHRTERNHVRDRSGREVALAPGQRAELVRQIRTLYGEAVPTLAAGARQAERLSIHVCTGCAATDVARFAQERAAGLVVLAAPGLPPTVYSPLEHTVESIVHGAPCPVLTVRFAEHLDARSRPARETKNLTPD